MDKQCILDLHYCWLVRFRLVGSCIPLTCVFDGVSKCDRENDSDTVRGS
jgi:hypothetical protein